jgi:thiol-disulfide isomerase/thioredoxin
MTGLRAFLGANVLLGIVALLLISTEWRKHEPKVVPIRIGELSEAEVQAALERMATTPNSELVIPTTTSVVTAPPTPAQRPKPTIAGPDLMTGKHLALSQFRGRPVFVSVWASWNAGSIDQASTIGRWAQAHESHVGYLGIDTGDSKREGRAFASRYGMTFSSISDPVEKFVAWGYVPTTLVFDRRHVLVEQIHGGATAAQLDAALRRVTE